MPARPVVAQPSTPEPQPVKQEEIVEKPADVKEDDDELAGEEIADDLSEISDEADDILNRQEVRFTTSSLLAILQVLSDGIVLVLRFSYLM